jgi:peptidoglycan/xylan/chitin deacetylase (PgdA/CDA1 family)
MMAGRQFTLTFDNGPWPGVTERVLDTLADRAVAATFFVVGQQLQRDGARPLTERAAAEGHWIGNHTMTHSVLFGDTDAPDAIEREIDAPQELIGALAHEARWFRPYGRGGVLDRQLLSADAVAHLERNGYSCVLWNSVPRDWEDVDGWVDRCLADVEAHDWTVVVVHDLPTGAMKHLPRLIDELASRDVDIVQGFPADCVPIDRGHIRAPLDHLMPPP